MEILDKLLKPQIIGPLIGMVAVIGAFSVAGLKAYFSHQERIAKIQNGIDPDLEDDEE